MIGSVTVGSLAATALSMTAEAALRGILGESTRTAYANLKERIAQWVNGDVGILERTDMSSVRKALVAKIIEQRSQADQVRIRDLTAALIEALKRDAQRGSVGISLRRLDAMQEQLRAVACP